MHFEWSNTFDIVSYESCCILQSCPTAPTFSSRCPVSKKEVCGLLFDELTKQAKYRYAPPPQKKTFNIPDVQEIAEASGRPSHVVGLHFFNPVQLMKLVEVVRCESTDPAVFEECKAWAKTVGKHPVSCVDTPGFIVNRSVCHASYREHTATSIVETYTIMTSIEHTKS